jgi:alanine racemase
VSRYNDTPIRPVWAEINLHNIQENIREIKRIVGSRVQVMAVVKAEAYGHGAVQVARAARQIGVEWFGVSLPEEGIELRRAGIDGSILVFSPLQPDQVKPVVRYDLISTICLMESAKALSGEAVRTGKSVKVHIKIDTGMGRVGVIPEDAVDFIEQVKSLPGLEVQGIYSHFATADEADLSYARKQLANFRGVLAALTNAQISIPVKHMANSGGIINLPESHFDLVRPGIIMYGLYPSQEVPKEKITLLPAFSLRTKVTHAKRVSPGTGVSYGQVYHAAKETNIATIPIGYADGWSRLLSGKASALIHEKRFPIIGNICMDQCMVDTDDEQVRPGDSVTLIGSQGDQHITADEIAKLLGTINYEVVCMISDRVPRIYL